MKTMYDKISLGGIDVKNRFVRSATHEGFSADGSVTPRIVNYYKYFAENEVGLIISSGLEVTEHVVFEDSMRIDTDDCIEPLRKITEAVHQSKGKIISQLLHGGTFIFTQPNYEPYGPSAVQDRFTQITAKEMSHEEIKDIVSRFADAAYRSKRAGFDGVQIQASFGFLLNKFISPFYNKRTDNYGGSIENRSRFIVEIRQAIADKCGKEYPVFIKLSLDDLMKEDAKGLEFSDGKEIAKYIARHGYDAMEITGGNFGEIPLTANYNDGKPHFKEQFMELSEEVKIPLIAIGGIREEADAKDFLNTRSIEAVAFSRPFIADVDLVKRWRNGESSRCTTCFQCRGENGIRCIKNI